jgi:citrate synthase
MSQWIGRAEALERLGVRAQTLYAYVSRGLIGAHADPEDPRRSLYAAADIERLTDRRRRGRKAGAIAASAIAWGEPSLPTRISTVARERLIFRGKDAQLLAETASLEEIAALLWELPVPPRFHDDAPSLPPAGPFMALAPSAQSSPASLGRSPAQLGADGAKAVARLATGFGLANDDRPLHARLAAHWAVDTPAADLLRRAMVLLADHELNASTFAVRVAASTGASIPACLLAGLATLSGPHHGGAAASLAMLIQQARIDGAEAALARWLASGQSLQGFGHPLYPQGDARGLALLEHVPVDPLMSDLRAAALDATGRAPNIDFALCALTRHLALPQDAPFILFALARSIGWVAHAIEQVTTGSLIRPRGRYEGPVPATD